MLFSSSALLRGLTFGAVTAATLTGCSRYTPPAGVAPVDNTAIIQANYDQAWAGMIDYVSATSFSIENFEKDSGLMILSFGGGEIARYVDCGLWQKDRSGLQGKMPYAARSDLSLRGRMNLRLRPQTDTSTDVRITARYVLRNDSGDVWEFTSERPATVRVRNSSRWDSPERTCRSTQAAEREIIDQIKALSASL